jgi:hypothetical protein
MLLLRFLAPAAAAVYVVVVWHPFVCVCCRVVYGEDGIYI